jgi:hypothetical protein
VTDAGGGTTWICVGPYGIGAPTRVGIDDATGGQSTGSGHKENADAAAAPAAPGSSATGGTTGTDQTSSGSSGGGCAIAPTGSGDALALLLGVPLLVVALRRRSRR